MAELTVVGVGITTLVVVVMELLKQIFPARLKDSLAVGVTVGVGVVLAYLGLLMEIYPEVATWGTPLVVGVLAAAAASGLYSWGKRRPGASTLDGSSRAQDVPQGRLLTADGPTIPGPGGLRKGNGN